MRFLFPISSLLAIVLGVFAPQQEPSKTILDRAVHLGNDATPEWPEAQAEPDAPDAFRFEFEASANQGELALAITQRHVDNTWHILINGKSLGALQVGSERKEILYPVPAGTLLDGTNTMSVQIDRVGDDITFGPVRLLESSYRDMLQIAPVRFSVIDGASGNGIPSRLTIVNENDTFMPIYYASACATPVRTGVAYTDASGQATVELAAGKYRVYATRGMEWGVAELHLEHSFASEVAATLSIEKELDTTGWLSADTHMHTLTFSGHGDALLEERVLTLAGEGLDVAIATDHNHHADYTSAQHAAGVSEHYLSIVGNEVTTDLGHMNAFPFTEEGKLPNHKLQEWAPLIQDIRDKGAQVVILNHPRWPDRDKGPYGVFKLDPRTGLFADGIQIPVDALEVFNSTTPHTPWPEVMRDWFSLMNAGSRIRGVGSSDSHSVLDPVGQGRTWLKSPTDDPKLANIDDICSAFREGHSSMGLGLFGEVLVQGVGPGELATPTDGEITIDFRIAGATWATAEKATVYMNGVEVASTTLPPPTEAAHHDQTVSFKIRTPSADAWLVCVATGPKPQGAWWYSLFDDLVLVTNPVWVDTNLDGVYQSPQETAAAACKLVGQNPNGSPRVTDLADILKECDRAVAVQIWVEAKRLWGVEHPASLSKLALLAPHLRQLLESLSTE
ncbi:MAG: CehA/McbA family metallohydrolase [Planctomycetota bacterium]|nr:CehA/McbA family metallohydrolase [Planctomycetota bacterium]MDA1113839.1 CehA/McbA family metallohydrolase [Planctomycetota bacterium]